MKTKLIFSFLLGLSLLSKAQHFDVGFGLGTGASYIFENRDQSIDITYSAPFSSYASLKYTPQNSYFDLKLNFQYANSGIQGENWKTRKAIDGEVSSMTTSLMLEHLTGNQRWNFGYNFGFGYTTENYIENLEFRSQSEFRKYMSVTLSGVLAVNVSEKLSIQLIPVLFWSDPANSFRTSNHWYIAGEDLSFLAQIGFVYRLK
ncbi:hypothetical protein [Owenweeksia hongkongensis]|uniref:hypothetical protein n=1 Tax=Owenweeksia hongkongensis TaxID=253245 RepID=UPI003A90CD81